jgi:hypothetical protein
MRASTLAVLAAFLPMLAVAAEQDDVTYRALVQRARSGDTTVDYRLLRLTCMKSDLCQPRGSKTDLGALTDAEKAGDLKKAAEIAEKLLDEGFVNLEAHASLSEIYQRLHDPEKAAFHFKMVLNMMLSIRNSGDGKTKETAFEVICDREEYDLLTSLDLPYYGVGVVSTRKITEGLHAYNRWEVRSPKTGQIETIFFNEDNFSPTKSHPRD